MTIQERIKARREELDMSQDELARKLGYSNRSAVCKIEKGEKEIRQSLIVQIAAALKTTPSYIMGWDEEASMSAQIADAIGVKRSYIEALELPAADRELIEAYHSADPITQANVCLLLGIKKEGGKSYHSAG